MRNLHLKLTIAILVVFGLLILGYVLWHVSPLKPLPVEDLNTLIERFSLEEDRSKKESTLMKITEKGEPAGQLLLATAKESKDLNTQFLAIRGLGYVKYKEAIPFLRECLSGNHHWIRANAARALGEMKAEEASDDLIRLLEIEKDGGVLEQTSLALKMIGESKAVGALRAAARHRSPQTRSWIIQAIGELGSKDDVPFVAFFLEDSSSTVQLTAASAIEVLAKEDFGLQKKSGAVNPKPGIERAKKWWKKSPDKFIKGPGER